MRGIFIGVMSLMLLGGTGEALAKQQKPPQESPDAPAPGPSPPI